MIKILFMTTLLSGCVIPAFHSTGLTPNSPYKIEQATFLSPSEPNWYLVQNDIHSLVFGEKFDDKKQTAIISASMYPVGNHKTARAFLEFIVSERTKEDDKARFKVLNEKNEYVTYNELPCLKYQTVSEDHKDQVLQYFKTSGYICRYPLEYIAFQVEVSHRSLSREFPADLLKTAEEFFQNIKLVDGTVKRLKTIK